MVTLSAKWISAELLEILSKKAYEVHSRFDSGCNLKVEDILCYIGNKHDTKLPYSVILKREDVPILQQLFQKEQVTEHWIWNEDRGQFEAGALIIETACADSFCSSIKKAKPGAQETLRQIVQAIDEELMTGFDLPVRDLLPEANRNTAELIQCLQSNDKENIRRVLKKVVGYGKGLTPSGDDFLQGIIYISELLADKNSAGTSQEFQHVLINLINHGYTTDTSVHYYRCALRGMYTEPLLQLANISDNSKDMIQTSISSLLAFGHTSGRDTAAGILAAVKGMKIL